MSTKLADTMIKSNMFQPHRKKSLESASNLMMHSNAKIDVKTFFEAENVSSGKFVLINVSAQKSKTYFIADVQCLPNILAHAVML